MKCNPKNSPEEKGRKPTTISGKYLRVGNPCTTMPCLPGTVYAVLANGRYYHLTIDGHLIKESKQWKEYIEKKQDHVKVTGYVLEKLDINGKTFYEIEVVSLEQE